MSAPHAVFNPPPGWPKPPDGWVPPKGWSPDPTWPDPPDGWQLWLPSDGADESSEPPPLEANEGVEGDQVKDQRVAMLEAENAALRAQLEERITGSEAVELNDEVVLQNVGIYRYHHPLENAIAYKERLGEVSAMIAESIKAGKAIEASNMFTFDNSLAKGRRMTANLGKLMLRLKLNG
ncbi:MAG: hypothetical protein ACKVKH_18280 [Verrucomicrobiales bacterium]